jgi:group II intron reverse transcriptase/maturase
VADLLSQIYEVDFLPCSFGGRKDRGAHHALSTLRESVMTEGVQWVIEADIKNFFGSISHEWMMKMLKLRVADPRVIKLIERWLKAGVMEGGQLQVNDLGTPQGGPISVLLSNVYLHYVLDLWLEYFVKPRVKGSLRVVRYIDDFVILFSRKEDAEAVYAVLGERLGKFGLELEPSKTRLAHFGLRSSLEDRRNGVKAKTIYFLGFTHYIGRSRRGKPMHKFKTEKSRLSRAHSHLKDLVSTHRHKSLREQQKRINQFLTGHFRYYGMSTNFDNLERIYHVAESQWRRALSRRSQLGKVTWIKMNRILKLFPLSKPRIFVDFGKISELASL